MSYQFRPLNTSQREIRLLKLDVTEERRHTLEEAVPLKIATYVALSYPWGDLRELSNLNVGGCNFAVSANLMKALDEVLAYWVKTHPGKQSIFLWTDQVCINQSNDAEKSSQVSLMCEIYARAHRVLVWLPTLSGVGEGFADWIAWRDWHRGQILDSQLSQLPQPTTSLTYAGDSDQVYPCASDRDRRTRDILLAWSHVLSIICSVWWERGWIYQEFMGPERATFLFNGKAADWKELHQLLDLFFSQKEAHTKFCTGMLTKLKSEEAGSGRTQRWWNFRNVSSKPLDSNSIARQRRCLRYHGEQIIQAAPAWVRVRYVLDSKVKFAKDRLSGKQYIALFSLLKHARNCQISNAKDRVYAFAGLADPSLNVKIDYGKSYTVNSVYVDAARAVIQQEGRLDILAVAQENKAGESSDRDRLPSWVPDWSTPDRPDSPYRQFIRDIRLPTFGHSYRMEPVRASADLPASVSFLADQFGNPNRVLETVGILVDEFTQLVVEADHKSYRSFLTKSNREVTTVKEAEVGDEAWILFGADEIYTLRQNGPFYRILGHAKVDSLEEYGTDIMDGGMIFRLENFQMVNRLQSGEVVPTTIFMN